MTDLMPMISAERHSLAEFLDTLTPEQWAAPTWCDKWNVQELVGHLTAAGNITAPHFFAGFVKTGFSFDKFVDGDLRAYAEGTPADVRARFGAILDSTRTPPGPAYVALGEVMVHGEDIRRALGHQGTHPPDHLTTLAELYKKTGAPLRAKKRIGGLRLEATDVDWSTGEGQAVRGPCMSLILGMVGRAGALADCEGPGVDTLRSRA
ncbi:MAG: maleylpyruvate isomerase family mycothiol-dependent enzyme [Acidimicrobiales bacterium]